MMTIERFILFVSSNRRVAGGRNLSLRNMFRSATIAAGAQPS
jgi:hypothetical protein